MQVAFRFNGESLTRAGVLVFPADDGSIPAVYLVTVLIGRKGVNRVVVVAVFVGNVVFRHGFSGTETIRAQTAKFVLEQLEAEAGVFLQAAHGRGAHLRGAAADKQLKIG